MAAKLLGPVGSTVKVVFRRGPKAIVLNCERRITNIKAAQQVELENELQACLHEISV